MRHPSSSTGSPVSTAADQRRVTVWGWPWLRQSLRRILAEPPLHRARASVCTPSFDLMRHCVITAARNSTHKRSCAAVMQNAESSMAAFGETRRSIWLSRTTEFGSAAAGRLGDNPAIPERWVRWRVYSHYRTPNVWSGRQCRDNDPLRQYDARNFLGEGSLCPILRFPRFLMKEMSAKIGSAVRCNVQRRRENNDLQRTTNLRFDAAVFPNRLP